MLGTPSSLDLERVMSTPGPRRIGNSWLADENPTSLTIRRVEAADANGSRSILGENAGRLRFELPHTERSKSTNPNTESARFAKADLGVHAENSGFFKVESSTFAPSTGKSRVEEDDNSELGSRGEKSGLRGPEDVEIEANKDGSKLGFGAGGYGSGSRVGGKQRSLRRNNKRTPYDRPVTGRHATAGGSAAMVAASLPSSKLTVASRLRDSASRFIYSSASYVLSALFKRAPPSVAATGESKPTGADVEAEMHKETFQTPLKQIDRTVGPASQVLALMDAGVKPRETEGRVLDIGQVEEILEQKTWSREQVDRLTRILQSRVSENHVTNSIVEAAENIEEQSKLEAKDASPVQVACAYMGEQVTRPFGIAPTVHKSTFLSTEVQPSPVCSLKDSYLSSPFSRNWARSSAAVRMPKRSLAREDDLASMGPVRRVRQKTSMLTNASPYSWCMTGLSKPLEMRASSPPSQSSQIAMKILETLEMLSPSPQEKFLDFSPEKSNIGLRVTEKFSPNLKWKLSNEIVGVAGTSAIEQALESSKAREKTSVENLGLVPSPKSSELKPISRITFGGMNFNNSECAKKSRVEAAPSISKFRNNMPVLGKGFRMNAVFEESNSDEESKLQAKPHASTEARDRTSHHNLKEEPNATPDSVVASTAADHSGSFLSEPVQASASSVPMLKSFSMPAMPSLPDKPEPLVSQGHLASHGFSFSPVAVETRSRLPGEMASSKPASAELKPSAEKVLSISNAAGASPRQQAEGSEMAIASTTTLTPSSTFSEFAITSVPLMDSVSTTAPMPLGNSSTDVNVFSAPIPMTSKTDICGMDVPEVGNERTMATESPVADKLDTMPTDSIADEADMVSMAPSASPTSVSLSNTNAHPSSASTFSYSGVSSTPSSAVAFPFSRGLSTASAGTSASLSSLPLFVFGGQSGTASAGQAPVSSIGGSASGPSAAAFTFGSQSNSMSAGQLPTFAIGVSASSSSSASFAFGGQSGTSPAGQAPTYVAKTSVLFDQSGTGSTGQALSFAMPSSPANPFLSTGGTSPFMFGSSTAAAFSSSAAPAFGSSAVFSATAVSTSSSSGLPGAGGLSTFQFVSAVGSSSSTSASSVSSLTTNSLTTAPFLSLPAPMLSTNPTFSFVSSAAFSFSVGSSPSGQLFAVGAAQPNPFAANPFSSSGVQNPAPSNFGASAVAVTPPFFSSSGSPSLIFPSNAVPNTSNMFTFGSNSTPNTSSPFTFGAGQSTPVQAPTAAPFAFGGQPTGQPFGFSGGQPAAPVSNPFSASRTTQPGPEFTGGFTLGATSGDKSGRKYIKARRIGAKRGK